jgi:hypothetical protein
MGWEKHTKERVIESAEPSAVEESKFSESTETAENTKGRPSIYRWLAAQHTNANDYAPGDSDGMFNGR